MLALLATTAFAQDNAQGDRSNRGVIALYDFASASGEIVTDRFGLGSDLKIANPSKVRRANGSLDPHAIVLAREGRVQLMKVGSGQSNAEAIEAKIKELLGSGTTEAAASDEK